VTFGSVWIATRGIVEHHQSPKPLLAVLRRIGSSPSVLLAAILIGGLLLRLALLPIDGRPGDIRDFVGWTLTIARFGTHGLYAHGESYGGHVVDYPPGFPLVLALIAHLYGAFHGADPEHRGLRALLKAPAIVSDLGLCVLLFLLARRSWSTRSGLLATAIIAFSPATWLISAY